MTIEGLAEGVVSSITSVPVTNCNVPDPISIEADFVYNFYVAREDVDYTPQPTTPIDYSGSLIDRETIDSIEERERGALSARVPRFIRVRISTLLEDIQALGEGEVSNEILQLVQARSSGQTSYSPEYEIENSFNARVSTIDLSASKRVQSLLYRVAAASMQPQSANSDYSDQMIAMTLNGLLSDDIDAAILMDALSSKENRGYKFVNQIEKSAFSRFSIRENTQFTSKINADGYRISTSPSTTSNPFSKSFISDMLGSDAQPSHRNWLLDASVFSSYEGPTTRSLDVLLPRLTVLDVSEERTIEASGPEGRVSLANLGYPTIRHAGYIIDKVETAPDGSQVRFEDIVLLKPAITEYIDPLVKYGHTYTYRARQLFIVKMINVTSVSPWKYQIVTSAIASSSPAPAVIKAVETSPPRAPGTLICSFIYRTGNGVRLDWTRPSNPTRDIKKYQVFRRKGILDPYQLIAEYDFTDSDYTQFVQRESVDPALVRRSLAPVYSHVDMEFNRSSSYMYCVASVDAHGLTSGYGTQVSARFDQLSNSLVTRIVSQAGAPKAYPNYYIDPSELEELGSDRLVEDVVRDSGHGRMRIYFNPDAYQVASDEDGTETQPIVLSSERGDYKFQVINLDRQILKTLSININKDRSLGDLF